MLSNFTGSLKVKVYGRYLLRREILKEVSRKVEEWAFSMYNENIEYAE